MLCSDSPIVEEQTNPQMSISRGPTFSLQWLPRAPSIQLHHLQGVSQEEELPVNTNNDAFL